MKRSGFKKPTHKRCFCGNKFELTKPWDKFCSPECEAEKRKTAKKIKPMSEKRKVELPIYTELRRVFLLKNPKCEIQVEGCTGVADQIHHAGRRGKNYLNTDTFVSTCDNCHKFTEANPIWARENGWLL